MEQHSLVPHPQCCGACHPRSRLTEFLVQRLYSCLLPESSLPSSLGGQRFLGIRIPWYQSSANDCQKWIYKHCSLKPHGWNISEGHVLHWGPNCLSGLKCFLPTIIICLITNLFLAAFYFLSLVSVFLTTLPSQWTIYIQIPISVSPSGGVLVQAAIQNTADWVI